MKMKKFIIGLALSFATLLSYSQSEIDLPAIATATDATIVRVVDPTLGSATMLRSILVQNDSLWESVTVNSVKFSGGTAITELADDQLYFTAGGSVGLLLTVGAAMTDLPFQFSDGDVSIRRTVNDLIFDDLNNTPKTLTELLAVGEGTYLGGSGITLNASTFDLGGALTDNVLITTDGVGTYRFRVQTEFTSLARSAYVDVDVGRIMLKSFSNTSQTTGLTDDWAEVYMADDILRLRSSTQSDATTMQLDETGVRITSTTSAFQPPKMTTVQRTALTPVEGDLVYDTDITALFSYRNAAWGQIASGTPVTGGDILILKADWRNFTFALGNGNTGDDAIFLAGAECGVWKESRAISVPEEFELVMEGSGADMTVQLFYGSNPTVAGTAICAPLGVATIGGITTSTTFLVATIPSGSYIWCEVISATGAPLKFRGSFSYSFQ